MGMKPIWLLVVVGAVLVSAAGTPALQAGPGVVRNAQTLHLRQGAGTDFPPIGVLRDGDRVEIKSVSGSWAAVRTSRGGTGYVRIEYLANQSAAKAREAPAPKATDTAEPAVAAAAPPADDLQMLRDRNTRLEAEVAALREQLAAVPPPQVKETDALRTDIGRVLALAEDISRRLNQKLETVDASDRPFVDQNVWLLAGVCVLFGVLLAGGYLRLQERSRRTRIRL